MRKCTLWCDFHYQRRFPSKMPSKERVSRAKISHSNGGDDAYICWLVVTKLSTYERKLSVAIFNCLWKLARLLALKKASPRKANSDLFCIFILFLSDWDETTFTRFHSRYVCTVSLNHMRKIADQMWWQKEGQGKSHLHAQDTHIYFLPPPLIACTQREYPNANYHFT